MTNENSRIVFRARVVKLWRKKMATKEVGRPTNPRHIQKLNRTVTWSTLPGRFLHGLSQESEARVSTRLYFTAEQATSASEGRVALA